MERLTGLYKNVKAGVVATVFRCRPLTEPAAETTEAAEVAWLDPADVLGVPELAPWSGQSQHVGNPEGAVWWWVFGPGGTGHSIWFSRTSARST